jgi:2-dehydropantoate 2-reductase
MGKRIGILGTGAVGGLYGGLLQAAGHDVGFLARSDAAILRQHGLHIRSPRGPVHLPQVKVYEDPVAMGLCDLILVGWKSTANKHLAETLRPLVHPETTVVVLQNGLNPECDTLSEEGNLRPDQVLAGLCFLCCRREGPGRIWHQDYGAITLAAFTEAPGPTGLTPRLLEAAEILRSCGEEIVTVPDWRLARWRKLVWNMAFNGPTALAHKNTLELLETPQGEALVLDLMREVVAGARACGVDLPEDFPLKMLASTRKMVAYEPSMKLDADAGHALEIEQVYSRPIRAIEEAGGEASRLKAIEALLIAAFQPSPR